MSDISTAEARRNLAELVNRVAYGKERVILTRHGKQLCAVIPIEDLSLLDRIRAAAEDLDVSDALVERDGGETVPWTALRRELGIPE